MARGKDFGLEYGLQSVVIGVVVNLTVDLLLDDLMLVGFDDFVRDSCSGFGQPRLHTVRL